MAEGTLDHFKETPKLQAVHSTLEGKDKPQDLTAEDIAAIDDARDDAEKNFGKIDKDLRAASIKSFRTQLTKMSAVLPKIEGADREKATANVRAVNLLVKTLENEDAKRASSFGEQASSGLAGAKDWVVQGAAGVADVGQTVFQGIGSNRWLAGGALVAAVLAAFSWGRRQMGRGLRTSGYVAMAPYRGVRNLVRGRRAPTATPAASDAERIAALEAENARLRSAGVATGSGYVG